MSDISSLGTIQVILFTDPDFNASQLCNKKVTRFIDSRWDSIMYQKSVSWDFIIESILEPNPGDEPEVNVEQIFNYFKKRYKNNKHNNTPQEIMKDKIDPIASIPYYENNEIKTPDITINNITPLHI